MKKSKLLILGLIALLLAGGLVLASCDSNCPGQLGAKKGECVEDVDGVIQNCLDNCTKDKPSGFKCDC
jgi:hypothetical protein